MRIRRLYLALAIALVLLNASLEATPKDVVVSMGFNPLSASPRNPGPYGTSQLLDILEDSGYRVVVVASIDDLRYALGGGGSRVVVSVIAPERIGLGEARELAALLEERPNTSLLIASENTEGDSGRLARMVSGALCGVEISLAQPASGRILELYNSTSRAALLIGLPKQGHRLYVVPTGYVTPILIAGREVNYTLNPPPETLDGAWVIAVAAPPPTSLHAQRFAAGVACSWGHGSLVVLGDSSIFVNELISYGRVRNAVLGIYDYLGGPNSTVVFVADLYSTNAPNVTLRFHPSMLLTHLAIAYKEVEDEAFAMLASRPQILALIAATLALVVYSAMPRGLWVRAGRGAERLPKPPRPPSFLGAPVELAGAEAPDVGKLCFFADELVRRRLGISLAEALLGERPPGGLADEALQARVSETARLCNELGRGGLRRLLRRIAGLEDRDRRRLASNIEYLWRRLGGV